MSALLQIKVLGEFAVRRDGEPVPLPPSRKTRALLAYLVVTARPQRRETLCEMFWDVPDDPRGSLRWSLSKLRQVLVSADELLLETDRNTVSVKQGRIDLDYDALRCLTPAALEELDVGQLEAIAAKFDGPFVADLHLPRCPTFEAWRVALDNETHLLRLKTLRRLIEALEHDPARALVHAQALAALCPEDDLSTEIDPILRRARTSAAARPAAGSDTSAPGDSGSPATTASAASVAARRQQAVHFCRAPDGVRLAYSICGDGPTIVRTGHWMTHLEYDWESPVWVHWIDGLTDGFRLVRYDQRLNGLSDQAADDLSLDAMVGDLECVVQAAQVNRFVLLGVSQGCALSVQYAVRHPDRVAGMILYGGYVQGWRARCDPSEVARREAMAVLIREGWGRDDPTFRQLFTNLFIPGASREQMDWFNELQKRSVTPENAWRLSNAFADVDVSDALSGVRVPTLILHARDDRVVPFSSGLAYAERIPGARFVELDSSNHILLAGEPAFQRFLEEVTTFARESLADRSTAAIVAKERRTATLLCADFISPHQELAHTDPEAALEAVDPLVVEAASIVRGSGGFVFDLSDTRLTASFDTRRAPKDHAAVACRTALELRELVRKAPGVRMRVAVDTGDIVIGPPTLGLEVRGAPLTVVHALSRAMQSDMIVATERTFEAVRDAVPMRPLTSERLSGFSQWQRLYRVVETGGP